MNELYEIVNVLVLVKLGYYALMFLTTILVIFTVGVAISFWNDIKTLEGKNYEQSK
jgi:hypothetical protein